MSIYPDSFEIVAFYGYPSYQQNIVAEFDEYQNRGDKSVMRFFNEILKKAEKLFGKKNLMDNKIVFKLQLKDTGTVIYCGYKDNSYRISLSATTDSFKKLELK